MINPIYSYIRAARELVSIRSGISHAKRASREKRAAAPKLMENACLTQDMSSPLLKNLLIKMASSTTNVKLNIRLMMYENSVWGWIRPSLIFLKSRRRNSYSLPTCIMQPKVNTLNRTLRSNITPAAQTAWLATSHPFQAASFKRQATSRKLQATSSRTNRSKPQATSGKVQAASRKLQAARY